MNWWDKFSLHSTWFLVSGWGGVFRKKYIFCVDGNKTDALSSLTYSTVLTQEYIKIIITIPVLNDLDIKGSNVNNEFLSAPNNWKFCFKTGKQFVNMEGKVFIVVQYLYGLNSAVELFISFMVQNLDQMGLKSCQASTNVWIIPAVKDEGMKYYEYILTCVYEIPYVLLML